MNRLRHKNIRWVLLSLVVLGLYTQATLFFPYDLYIVPGVAALFISHVRTSLVTSTATLAVVMFALFLISVVFRNDSLEQYNQLRSLFLFFLTILAASGALSMVLDLSRETAFRYVRFIILVILAGLLLERLGIIKPASDAFREWLYPETVVYSNDIRDISNYGFVRPKLFASEPSYVAKFFGTMVAAAIVLRPTGTRMTSIFLWVGAFMVLLPSAAIVFGVGAGFLFLAFGRSDGSRSPIIARTAMVVALVLFGFYFTYEIADRLGVFTGRLEASAFERLKQPFLLAVSAIKERPLFGYGIGAESGMIPLLEQVRMTTDTPLFFLLKGQAEAVRGSFLFAMLWQFGIVGTAALWLSIVTFIRKIAPGNLFFGVVFFLLLGLTAGDIHTPASWGYFSLFLGALAHTSSSNKVSDGESLAIQDPPSGRLARSGAR